MKRSVQFVLTWFSLIMLLFVNVWGIQSNPDSSNTIQTDVNYLEADSTVIIKTIDGRKKIGRLLFVSDSSVIFTKQFTNLNSEEVWTNSINISYRFIDSIFIVKEGDFWNGALIGLGVAVLPSIVVGLSASSEDGFMTPSPLEGIIGSLIIFGLPASLIGGAIGASGGSDYEFNIAGNIEKFRNARSYLLEHSYYISPKIKETRKIVQSSNSYKPKPVSHFAADQGIVNKKTGGKLKKVQDESSKFHISVCGVYISSSANQEIINAFNSSGFGGRTSGWGFSVNYPVDHSDVASFQIMLSYSVVNNLRIGLSVNPFPFNVYIKGINSQNEKVNRTSYALLAEYVFHQPWARKSGLGFSMAGGLSYNLITIYGFLKERGNDRGDFKFENTEFGLLLTARLDYYTSKNFSFFVGITKSFIPSIDVPTISSNKSDGKFETLDETQTLSQHSVNAGYFGVDFGIAFHFGK
ncbi:MAG: hypothetical protein GXO87_06435 [Chlorobi bacterium]|nr:hypothetical protein [Chlorobiota bacterium]